MLRVVPDHPLELPLAKVVGANCKRLRTAICITQDGLAQYARSLGLRWTASKVGDFEAGRSAPTLATVLIVGDALAWAAAQARFDIDIGLSDQPPPPDEVTLADLLDGGSGFIVLSDEHTVRAADLVAVARGRGFESWDGATEPLTRQPGMTEKRIAKNLNVSDLDFAETSFLLWGKTFSEERDSRAGVDANQQRKGRISREMRAEIEKALTNGDDQ